MEQDLAASYSYSSKPRAVQTSRGKTRDVKTIPTNIMHDPRIPRGSVFAPLNTARTADGREKVKKRRSTKKRSNNNKSSVNVFGAMAVPSYGFTSISLEANLVEQIQLTPERESFSQTDEFLPRSSSNQGNATTNDTFMRPKIGIDTSTQIEETDGLFNFDLEVKPLLNVLVNKTLAQALAEIKEEQEMQMLHRQREVLTAEKRDAKMVERELEDKAKEANRRKELTKKKRAEKQHRDQVTRKKLLAWQFARPLVSEAISQAASTLQKKGVFYDPMLRNLAIWLGGDIYEGADANIRLRALSSELLDDLILHGLRRQALFAQLLPDESEAMVRLLLRDPLILPLPDEAPEGTEPLSISVIGPIALSRTDSLESIENRIKEWIEEHLNCPVDIPVGGFISLLQLAKNI